MYPPTHSRSTHHMHIDADASSQRAASTRGQEDRPTLLSAPLSFKDTTSATDDKLMDLMWGKDKVRQARNDQVRP